jgi:hypothetical protein
MGGNFDEVAAKEFLIYVQYPTDEAYDDKNADGMRPECV